MPHRRNLRTCTSAARIELWHGTGCSRAPDGWLRAGGWLRRRRLAGRGCDLRAFGGAAFNAELVAFGVGQKGPSGAVASAVVGDEGRADGEKPRHFFVAGPVGRRKVEVHAVLDGLAF